MTHGILTDMQVLVTRPDPAGTKLCNMLKASGAIAHHVATIAFAPPPNQTDFDRAIEAIGEQDWLIFVSPQAVYASISAIRQQWPVLPPKTKLAAIGQGTAKALEEAGYHAHLYPEAAWSSESLIDLPDFQYVEGAKIAIIRGEGGREILEKILGERGAQIMSIAAYKRVLPQVERVEDLRLFHDGQVDVIVCASFEGVKNLKTLFGSTVWPQMSKTPLIVISKRIKELARELGFATIWVAKDASHESIIQCLAEKKEEIWQIKQISI